MSKRDLKAMTIEYWREKLTPEEKKRLYLDSIPEQVRQSMAFEDEHISLKMLKEYLNTLKNTQ